MFLGALFISDFFSIRNDVKKGVSGIYWVPWSLGCPTTQEPELGRVFQTTRFLGEVPLLQEVPTQEERKGSDVRG